MNHKSRKKKEWAVIKHIAELADKHCPDLGVKHDARPALEVIENYLTEIDRTARSEERERIIERYGWFEDPVTKDKLAKFLTSLNQDT